MNNSKVGAARADTTFDGQDAAEADSAPLAEWLPGVMLADLLDASDDGAAFDAVNADAWEALRALKRKYDVPITKETTFGELVAVPEIVAEHHGFAPTRAEVDEFVSEYAYPLPDPHETGEGLIAARRARYARRTSPSAPSRKRASAATSATPWPRWAGSAVTTASSPSHMLPPSAH